MYVMNSPLRCEWEKTCQMFMKHSEPWEIGSYFLSVTFTLWLLCPKSNWNSKKERKKEKEMKRKRVNCRLNCIPRSSEHWRDTQQLQQEKKKRSCLSEHYRFRLSSQNQLHKPALDYLLIMAVLLTMDYLKRSPSISLILRVAWYGFSIIYGRNVV